MKIIFSKNLGFCSGVIRALSIANQAITKDPKPIQFLGSLVHNELVTDEIKKRGVKFIKDPQQAKEGTIIIQAHGFPFFEDKISKEILIRDATCPLVKRAQIIAEDLYKKNYQVIIIGDKNHPEVKGINSRTGNTSIIVEDTIQAKRLNLPKDKKIGVLSQTTQNRENVKRILDILLKKSKNIEFFDTICPEVEKRQKELNKIFKKCDGILVIGSRTSANTTRLFLLAKEKQKKAFWVNSLEELKKKEIKGVSVLGVVSGTSSPNWEIEKIKRYLKEKYAPED